MPRPLERAAISVLIPLLAAGVAAAAAPAADLSRAPGAPLAAADGFLLGVRGRTQPFAEPPAAAESAAVDALEWRLDERQVAEALDAQAQGSSKSKWNDLSKTTRVWLIVGGVLAVGIIVAAMD
jgi:hypothetical protein